MTTPERLSTSPYQVRCPKVKISNTGWNLQLVHFASTLSIFIQKSKKIPEWLLTTLERLLTNPQWFLTIAERLLTTTEALDNPKEALNNPKQALDNPREALDNPK